MFTGTSFCSHRNPSRSFSGQFGPDTAKQISSHSTLSALDFPSQADAQLMFSRSLHPSSSPQFPIHAGQWRDHAGAGLADTTDSSNCLDSAISVSRRSERKSNHSVARVHFSVCKLKKRQFPFLKFKLLLTKTHYFKGIFPKK